MCIYILGVCVHMYARYEVSTIKPIDIEKVHLDDLDVLDTLKLL